jgi:hypothetical protein
LYERQIAPWAGSRRPSHREIRSKVLSTNVRGPSATHEMLVPALGTRLTLNGKPAAGESLKREREKRPSPPTALGSRWRGALGPPGGPDVPPGPPRRPFGLTGIGLNVLTEVWSRPMLDTDTACRLVELPLAPRSEFPLRHREIP